MPSEISSFRWYAKKASRRLVASTAGAVESAAAASSPRIRALTYHRFGTLRRDPFCISASDFENQIAYIAKSDIAIGYPDLLSYVRGEHTLDKSRVVVTIDDGYLSTHSIARDILSHFAVPAITFISPRLIGQSSTDATQPEPYMNWQQVEALHDAGIHIGSHSLRHESYGRLTTEQVRNDARESRADLCAHVPYDITAFAYPFGTRADFDANIARILADCGYETAFTSQHGSISRDLNPLLLPRIKVENGDSIAHFRRLTRGAMDSWRFVDTYLQGLQANR